MASTLSTLADLPTKERRTNMRTGQLVYQVGIANVFLSIGEGTTSKRTRVYQGDYRGAELISAGLKLAGLPITVWHCDHAGDCASMDWTIGPGELWADSKHSPLEGAL